MISPISKANWIAYGLLLLSAFAKEKSKDTSVEKAEPSTPDSNAVTTPYRYVAYWGQNSYGASHPNSPTEWEKPLDIYCEEETADIVVLSFLHVFNAGTNNPPEINLSYHCNTTFSEYPNLLSCPKIGQHIQKCQAKGKKVLLSLGGSAGSYGFKEEKHGGIFAKTLWNMFLGGESEYRPFGEAKLDGIDLDIEGGSSIGYTEMIKGLRSLFSKNEKSYLITGAPQCTFPDVYFGKVLDEAWFDYVFVQYYNNFCGVQNFNNPWAFNFAEWENWSETKAINPNVKVLLGVPGSPSAANLGYVDLKTLYPIVKNVSQTYKNFGGVMVWDVSQADGNQVGEHKFKFSEVVGSWLKSPGALGVPATKPTTTPAKPEEGYLDSEGRLDFKNLIETESIPDSGSECSKKVLACGETGYMVCYEGKWKAKSCPAGAKCTSKSLEMGSPCAAEEEAEEEDASNSALEEGEALYDIDMVPLPLNPASPVSSFSVRIRSKTTDPISLNWKISLPQPDNLHFLSTSLGAPKVSKRTLEITSNYPERSNEPGLVPTRPVKSYMSIKFVVNFIDKEWSLEKLEESKNQVKEGTSYVESFRTIDSMLADVQFVDLDRMAESQEASSEEEVAQVQSEESAPQPEESESEQEHPEEQEAKHAQSAPVELTEAAPSEKPMQLAEPEQLPQSQSEANPLSQQLISAISAQTEPIQAEPVAIASTEQQAVSPVQLESLPQEAVTIAPAEQAAQQPFEQVSQGVLPAEPSIQSELAVAPIEPSLAPPAPQQPIVSNTEAVAAPVVVEAAPPALAPAVPGGVKEFRMMEVPLLETSSGMWYAY